MFLSVDEIHSPISYSTICQQYDFRETAAAKATFHLAINDPHHKGWKECPPRRSIECRVILTFEPEMPKANL